jgi:pyruvyltransferase
MDINLLHWKYDQGHGNFGDEISKFIVEQLLNKEKYKLHVNLNTYLHSGLSNFVETKMNQPHRADMIKCNKLIAIGSYLHMAENETHIYGSGMRIPNQWRAYTNLNVHAVRGPITRLYLEMNNIKCPKIYGDPALLLRLFYKPKYIENLKDKIAFVPHFSNMDHYYSIDKDKYELVLPTEKWEDVVDKIYSCKYTISSSLHGLICSDAYDKPNIWLNEYGLDEGDWKFMDYFESQKRDFVNISNLDEFEEKMLYTDGNKIDLEMLVKVFPFS